MTASSDIDWTLVLTAVGAVASVIAAVAVVVGGIYWLRTRDERAERAAREKQVSEDVADMSERIEHLQGVVDAVAEDQSSRRPRPSIAFSTQDGPSEYATFRIPALSSVDVEAIVAAERAVAMSTLLPTEDPPPEPTDPVHAIARLAGAARMFGSPLITEAHHAAFRKDVDDYEPRLRAFIADWIAYRTAMRTIVGLRAVIDNDGGAPAEDARVRLRFPDPCVQADWPEKPKRPRRPKFERPANPLFGQRGSFPNLAALGAPIPHVPEFNRHGPFYDDGSLLVRFYYTIPHHDPLTTDLVLVGVPEPGVFSVDWTIGASNLAQPATGTLTLTVEHPPAPSEPVTTLADLLEAGRPN